MRRFWGNRDFFSKKLSLFCESWEEMSQFSEKGSIFRNKVSISSRKSVDFVKTFSIFSKKVYLLKKSFIYHQSCDHSLFRWKFENYGDFVRNHIVVLIYSTKWFRISTSIDDLPNQVCFWGPVFSSTKIKMRYIYVSIMYITYSLS